MLAGRRARRQIRRQTRLGKIPGSEAELFLNGYHAARQMKLQRALLLAVGLIAVACPMGRAEELFRDDFTNRLAAGWSWVREDKSGWRVTERGLEIRVKPGNMWGPPNNATNVLTRPLPKATTNEIEIAVTAENRPTAQYEQVDLVWYYDDSHMVKLGLELVDGKLSIVMGREENDKTSTMAILPTDSFKVSLRLTAKEERIRGEYRLPGQENWTAVGECGLPVKGNPQASLQVYQGPKTGVRWARFTDFRVVSR